MKKNDLIKIKKVLKNWESLYSFSEKKIITVRRKITKKNILIISPHPDDEVLLGSLALRLQKENDANIWVFSYSLGSLDARQKERRFELMNALKFLKWNLIETNSSSANLKKFIKKLKPFLIITYHIDDNHPTHKRCSKMVFQCLKDLSYSGFIALGEYWSKQKKSNLLIELTSEEVLTQIKALTYHHGEIVRNPYHLRLPALLVDNVRIASETLKPKGDSSFNFMYGAIYQLKKMFNGKALPIQNQSLSKNHDISDLFF